MVHSFDPPPQRIQQELYASRCGITDFTLRQLAKSCPLLVRLDLSHNRQVRELAHPLHSSPTMLTLGVDIKTDIYIYISLYI